MKITTSMIIFLLLLSIAASVGCQNTQEPNASDFEYVTYVNRYNQYMVDYPAEWQIQEWDQGVCFFTPGKFSMFAEIVKSTQADESDNALITPPLGCNEYQIIDRSGNTTSFSSTFGKTVVLGSIHTKRIYGQDFAVTLMYEAKPDATDNLRTPAELQFVLNSLRPIEATSPTIPTMEPLEPPPTPVNINQIYFDYKENEAAAETKYGGQRLLLTGVIVDEVNSFLRDPDPQLGGTGPGFVFKKEPEKIDIYIMSGSVKFRPRESWIIFSLRVGCKLDIVGEVLGLESDILIIHDCIIQNPYGKQSVVY